MYDYSREHTTKEILEETAKDLGFAIQGTWLAESSTDEAIIVEDLRFIRRTFGSMLDLLDHLIEYTEKYDI